MAKDTPVTIESAARLHARATRPNLFIKVPGSPEGIAAIEEIFAGVPIDVTLLFSRAQNAAAAEALRGIERRIPAALDPKIGSVPSLFVSRWDAAVKDTIPARLRNRHGIAVAMQGLPRTARVATRQALVAVGALAQRLLWASIGTKDPAVRDALYIEALAAPDTISTIPEKALFAFADHGEVRKALPLDGDDSEAVLAECRCAGIDDAAMAGRLQREGADAFSKSWHQLLQRISAKTDALGQAGAP